MDSLQSTEWIAPGPAERLEGLDRAGRGAAGHGGQPAGGPLVALLCPEPRLRRILRLALETEGYRPLEWSDASRPAGPAVDLVVVDLDSLGWRPPAAFVALRAGGLDDRTALLLISVYPAEAERAGYVGPLEYLQPPFAPGEFVARVGRLLQRSGWLATPGSIARGDPPPPE